MMPMGAALNLWRPAPWNAGDDAEEPSVFLEHLAYILDDDAAAKARSCCSVCLIQLTEVR